MAFSLLRRGLVRRRSSQCARIAAASGFVLMAIVAGVRAIAHFDLGMTLLYVGFGVPVALCSAAAGSLAGAAIGMVEPIYQVRTPKRQKETPVFVNQLKDSAAGRKLAKASVLVEVWSTTWRSISVGLFSGAITGITAALLITLWTAARRMFSMDDLQMAFETFGPDVAVLSMFGLAVFGILGTAVGLTTGLGRVILHRH